MFNRTKKKQVWQDVQHSGNNLLLEEQFPTSLVWGVKTEARNNFNFKF